MVLDMQMFVNSYWINATGDKLILCYLLIGFVQFGCQLLPQLVQLLPEKRLLLLQREPLPLKLLFQLLWKPISNTKTSTHTKQWNRRLLNCLSPSCTRCVSSAFVVLHVYEHSSRWKGIKQMRQRWNFSLNLTKRMWQQGERLSIPNGKSFIGLITMFLYEITLLLSTVTFFLCLLNSV